MSNVVNYIVNSNPATNASHCVCVAVIPAAQLSVSVQQQRKAAVLTARQKSGAKFSQPTCSEPGRERGQRR